MANTDRQNLLSDAQPMGVGGNMNSGNNNNNTILEIDVDANQQPPSILKQSSHPVCLIFHFLFRVGAICTYLFGGWFSGNFVLIFVLCVLQLVFDFWVVKNVSGRLLVGLRWWSESREDGSTTWLFESRDPSRPLNPVDSRLFWTGLYVAPAIWTFFGILCIFTFKLSWLLVVAVALALNMANVIGYTQCDKDAKQKWATGFASNMLGGASGGVVGGLMSRGLSRMTGSLF